MTVDSKRIFRAALPLVGDFSAPIAFYGAVDDALDAPIVTVTDRDTNELIRRIPSEDLISLARFVERQTADSEITAEKIKGVLLSASS